ncbi:hypothetical protein DLM75_20010 [Leptospira stimsonii]|uniref:Uncharacterized protein n=1 Tax=Leptospira stimsonii TaxID=2202203 RepID=A0A396YWI8_9LEPT|nr:hypothetical protein DLM75_20010 [Leptospira stimsonii]
MKEFLLFSLIRTKEHRCDLIRRSYLKRAFRTKESNPSKENVRVPTFLERPLVLARNDSL